MNAADRSQLLQLLHGRRDAIADRWHQAIAGINSAPLNPTEVHQRLAELTDRVVGLLLAEPFDRTEARAIGAALARLDSLQPEALGRTQEVLACQLLEALPAQQVVALQPRLAALLGGLATGFFRQARDEVLAEQEQIQRALAAELWRLGQALQDSEEAAWALLNAPADPMLLLDSDVTIVDLNEAAAQPLLPPRREDRSMADQYRSCCLRACPKRSAPGSGVSGLPLHSLALRPADSLAARGGFRRWASAVRSPSLPPSKLRGFGLLPRQASYSCWTRQPLLAARGTTRHSSTPAPRLPPSPHLPPPIA